MPGLPGNDDHVGIGRALSVGDLLRTNLLQFAQLIAQPRRILELQRPRRGLHASLQFGDHFEVTAFEHTDGPLDIARVARGIDQTYAWR